MEMERESETIMAKDSLSLTLLVSDSSAWVKRKRDEMICTSPLNELLYVCMHVCTMQ